MRSSIRVDLFCIIVKDFNIQHVIPVKLYEDNSSIISIVKYGNMTENSKHIETHLY